VTRCAMTLGCAAATRVIRRKLCRHLRRNLCRQLCPDLSQGPYFFSSFPSCKNVFIRNFQAVPCSPAQHARCLSLVSFASCFSPPIRSAHGRSDREVTR